MATITLQCVKEYGKLRIKFVHFTDCEGKIHTNVYNTKYNCRFPKNIREAGVFYEIPDTDLSVSNGFYSVKTGHIKIIHSNEHLEDIIKNTTIFGVDECIVCLSNIPNILFTPCGHQCVCEDCNKKLNKISHNCPLCRRYITRSITIN